MSPGIGEPASTPPSVPSGAESRFSDSDAFARTARVIVRQVQRMLPLRGVWVFAADESRRELRLAAGSDLPDELSARLSRLSLTDPFVASRAAASAGVLFAEGPEAGPIGNELLLRSDATALMALPLRASGRLVGVLTCARSGSFEDVDPATVVALADVFAAGLANADALGRETLRRARLDRVRRAALAVAESRSLEETLQTVVDEARKVAGAAMAGLGMLPPQGGPGSFDPWIQSGMTDAEAAALGRQPRPVGLLGAVCAGDRPVRLRDVASDPRHRGLPKGHPPIRAFLGAPVRVGGQCRWALFLANKQGSDEFTVDDEQAIGLLLEHASLAVEQHVTGARLVHDLAERERAQRNLATQYSTARVLAEARTLGEASRRVLEALCETLGWEWGALWAVDRATNVLRCAELWHAPSLEVPRFDELTRSISFPPGVGIPGRVWASARAEWVTDVADDPRYLRLSIAAKENLHGAFFLPVSGVGRVLGVIEIISRRSRAPDEELLASLSATASQVGQFIERMQVEQERERLLEDLAAERSWLRTVLDRAPVGFVLVLGPGRGGCLANPRAEELFGQKLTADGDLSQYRGAIFTLDGRRLDASELPDRRALRGEVVHAAELLLRHPDGREQPVLASAVPIDDVEGRRTGAAVVIEDLLPVREIERLREEWTSVVAHDLRQPVSTIAAAAGLLARRESSPEVKSRAENILRSARRLDRMIGDLQDLSRLSARRMPLNPASTDLPALVRGALEDMQPQLDGHAVRVAVRGDVPRLAIDPQRIEQAFENLVSNAVKYSHPGTAVEVEIVQEGREVRVSVSNEGPGMQPEEIKHLFSRFHRTPEALRSTVPGSGLGLYIARGLVEAHGGRTWAESVPDHRTTFHFALPVGG